MQFNRRRAMKHTKIEIIPMIDTMFFLLVFFILTSLNLVRLTVKPVTLPKAATATPELVPKDLAVTITGEGTVYVGDQQVNDMTQIGPMLVKLAGSNADLAKSSVTVNAARDVEHGVVVKVMDAARKSEFARFAISTDPESRRATTRQ